MDCPPPGGKNTVSNESLRQYLNILALEGICKEWLYGIEKCILTPYLQKAQWMVDLDSTLAYLLSLKEKYSASYYRKHLLQIRKFLQYLDIEWSKKIIAPDETTYTPKRISNEDIQQTVNFFKDNPCYLQTKALILLGITSGMRAEETYQLRIEDIDLSSRTVRINNDPKNHQSTKTGHSRVSFFTEEAKEALEAYLGFYKGQKTFDYLFGASHITRLFSNAPVKVKDFRKYFSQNWDRLGGPTGVKKLLMGHSFRNDTDLKHYNGQNEEDLKRIYDKVMGQGV